MGEQEGLSAALPQCAEQACNVPASAIDVRESVVNKERWEELCRMKASGMSTSAISRATGLDRKTVRACLRKGQWEPYRRAATGETLLSAHRAWLIERAPQVNYSAQILFQELRASRSYTGGYDTVRNAVRPLRVEASAQALTQRRFETEPGQQAQADWGQVRVRFASGPAQVHIFVMTLGYSRRAYAEGYENERMGALLSAHEHAFRHFGGRTAEILYDRMRTVTTGMVSAEGKPRWNARFEAFARHWGFEPRLCRPYRAQTKGKVESGVKYVKRNFLPGRLFRDLDDFNEQLAGWQSEVADVRIHGTVHERPVERFAREAAALVSTLDQPSFYEAIPRSRRRGQRLARRHRRQPLFGSVASHRQDGPSGTRRLRLAHLAPGQACRRASGLKRSLSAQRTAGARPGRCRTQCTQALQRRTADARCPARSIRAAHRGGTRPHRL